MTPNHHTKDPSENTSAALHAAVKRMEDVHNAHMQRIGEQIVAEARRVNELMILRADYSKQLDEAESKRIDAIRAVDVSAVSVASERATQQAAVLASAVATSAEALRTLVATTAAAVAQSLSNLSTQLTDRLTALERSQYENKGTGAGQRDVWGWLVAAIAIVVAVGGFVVSYAK